jgi:molybdopterin-dependent oxidoreductase alpha subunit
VATRPPLDDVPDDLTVSAPKQYAAGLPAVRSSLEHAYRQMGVRRSLLTLVSVNQKKGFDCPGCAWPEGDHRHAAEFCENGAKAVAEEATLRRVGPAFFAQHSVSSLAEKSDYWLGQQGRLTHPMYKPEGSDHYLPVSWARAFEILATELKALGSPDEALFYTSGRTSNEAAFLYQLFVRLYGTNNLPDCSNMCHESSGSALGETLGIGKGTVSLEDVHQADLIIVAGQNPGTNHPRMLSALEKAKKAGAKIITVNPLPEAGLIRFKNPQRPSGVVGKGTTLTDLYLQVRLSGDLALFRALNRLLLEAEDRAPGTVLDQSFIGEYTHGFAQFAAEVRATPWDAPAPAYALSAGTATSRATGRWASTRSLPRGSWTGSAPSSRSNRRGNTGTTWWRPSRPCATAVRRCSSGSAATSSARHRTPRSRRRPSAAAVSRRTSPPS